MTLMEMLPQLSSMTDADAKGYALVFGAEPYEALQIAQEVRPSVQHRAAPVQLTNGQWMLCADLLLEIGHGGLYADGFVLLPFEIFEKVKVVPWEEAVALLPLREEIL